jgi:hypothetical protein
MERIVTVGARLLRTGVAADDEAGNLHGTRLAQTFDRFDAGLFFRWAIIIRDNQVGRMIAFCESGEGRTVGAGSYYMPAPAWKESARPLQHKRIVINEHDELAIGSIRVSAGADAFATSGRAATSGTATAKAGPLAQSRHQGEWVIEQPAQPIDCKT